MFPVWYHSYTKSIPENIWPVEVPSKTNDSMIPPVAHQLASTD